MSKNNVLEIGLMPNLDFVHHLTVVVIRGMSPTTPFNLSAPIYMLNIKQHKCKYFYFRIFCAFVMYFAKSDALTSNAFNIAKMVFVVGQCGIPFTISRLLFNEQISIPAAAHKPLRLVFKSIAIKSIAVYKSSCVIAFIFFYLFCCFVFIYHRIICIFKRSQSSSHNRRQRRVL